MKLEGIKINQNSLKVNPFKTETEILKDEKSEDIESFSFSLQNKKPCLIVKDRVF